MFRKKKVKPENLLASYVPPPPPPIVPPMVRKAKIFTGALAGQLEEELNAWLSVVRPRRVIEHVYFSVMDAKYAQKYAALIIYSEQIPTRADATITEVCGR